MSDIDTTELVKLEKQALALDSNPEFVKYLKLKQDLDTQLADARKRIQGQMELSHTKKISGDWGYITLVERTLFDTTDELPAKYWKKVPDTKKISEEYKLKGKLPKGATPKVSSSLRIGIK